MNINNCPVKINDQAQCPKECARNEGEPTYSEMVELLTEIVDREANSEDETNFVGYFGSRNTARSIELYNQIRGKVQPETIEMEG